MQEVQPGIWYWTAPHPEWTPPQDWAMGDVSCYAMDDGERLLLFDPLSAPSEMEELAAGRETAIVLTSPWHQRDAMDLAERLGAPIFVPPPDRDPDPMWLKLAGITAADLKDKIIYKPRGCDYCTGTGFRGRIGIFEMMHLNGEIRGLAFDRAPTNKIRKAALARGMKSLLADGRIKVLNGTTTAEEVVKVAQVEGIVTG